MIVLDTHVWLWWLHSPAKLSRRARRAIEEAEAEQAARVSAISVWEVAVKVRLGKLPLPMDVFRWYELARSYPGITIEPLDPLDAIASTRLPGTLHEDPADRIIVAFTRRHQARLVTRDRVLRHYEHVPTVW